MRTDFAGRGPIVFEDVQLPLAIRLLRDGGKGLTPLLKEAPTGMEFRIRSLPREEQLAFLARLSDALGGPRKSGWRRVRNLGRER